MQVVELIGTSPFELGDEHFPGNTFRLHGRSSLISAIHF
jgi:hypothetical protein